MRKSIIKKMIKLKSRILLTGFAIFLLGFSASISLVYETAIPGGGHGTMDSVAIWVAENPQESLLFITDKTYGYLEMHNPVTNQYIGRIGGNGSSEGKLGYPNGVGVAYNVATGKGMNDVVFAVERDNNRVSMFSLPEKEFIGSFGGNRLDEPYGIGFYKTNGVLQAWITNTGDNPNTVAIYNITATNNGATGDFVREFNTLGELESIVIDPVYQEVYLSDESEERNIMVYGLNGNFKKRIGHGLFVEDPEGIALYDIGSGNGWLVVSDQNSDPTQFEIFERGSLKHLGYFIGETDGTDGLTLTQYALPNFPDGSFYAVHSDKRVHAYDWKDIAAGLNLDVRVLDRASTSVQDFESGDGAVPEELTLSSVMPNPYSMTGMMNNGAVHFELGLLQPESVTIQIYNILGQTIRQITYNEQIAAGKHQYSWDVRNTLGEIVPVGIYIVAVRTNNFNKMTKMSIIR
ncbi:MAG: T9SS C-terminal target domain-containing protein [Calditrichaeota bacterium]|nr:MAG: T9SS C-terminal target domain-containing protein [Calditrichota bacterium]